jgi:peptidoglycan-N-acetylglucosamine deacetylase
MPSQPSDQLVAGRRPRHAAETARHALPEDASAARHRRPESLADAPPTPPTVAIWTGDIRASATRPGRRRRAAEESATRFQHADAEIRAARQAAQRHSGLITTSAGPHGTGQSRVERRRQERDATRRSGRHKAPRGRHAKPVDPLNITVRPAAGVVRDWARADSRKPPVTGSRRAPGTLPIESWLLIGKTRQQLLLASLVAVGLALVMIPAAQRDDTVSPVNAAGQATVTTKPAGKAEAKPPPIAKKPTQRPKPTEKDQSGGTPATTAPPAPGESGASGASGEIIAVPAGDGPFRSRKTTGTAAVALTFDDGPDPVQTPKILAMLAEYQVKATFCLVGEQVEKHPEIVRDIVAAGHTLCNHTWDHSLTIGKDEPAVIAADLARTNQAMHNAVPGVQIPFFRAPGGNFSDRLVQVAYADGMTSLYWEVDPRDWDHDKAADTEAHIEKVVEDVRNAVKPGSIVLSHDFNQPDTITAYERLLPWLAENFELGTPQVAGQA